MRYVFLLSAAWAVALSGGCSQTAEPATNPLFGKWEAVSGNFLGQEIRGKQSLGMRITFGPDKAIWHFNTPEGAKSYDGYYRIDETTQPCQIDLRQPDSEDVNRTLCGIYRIDGDTLRIYMGAERPKDFEAPVMAKLVLKRVEP
jgi:uncharacterized protein (TIGR03067 family)